MLKGLILKNLYSLRFTLILVGALQAFHYFFMVLALVGMTEGFFRDNEAPELYMVISAFDFVFILLFSSFALNPVAEDKKSGWEEFSLTLPVKNDSAFYAQLVAAGVNTLINILIAIVANLLFAAITGSSNFEILLIIPFVSGLLELSAISYFLMLGKKFTFHVAEILYVAILILIAAAAIVLAVLLLSSVLSAEVIRIIGYCAAAAVIIPAALLPKFSKFKSTSG